MRYLIKPILLLILILMITGCGGGSNPPGSPNPPGSNVKITIIAGRIGTNGALDGSIDEAAFVNPKGIAVDRFSNLYVTDGDAVRKIVYKNGTYEKVITIAGSYDKDLPGADDTFDDPLGIAVNSQGVLYVADLHTIWKLTSSDGENYQVDLLAGTGEPGSDDAEFNTGVAKFNQPTSLICVEGDEGDDYDYLYVTDLNGIRKITLTSSNYSVETIKDKNGEKISGRSVAYNNQDFLYVADTVKIKKVHADYQVDIIAGIDQLGFKDGPGSEALFNQIWGITADGFGNLYVADRVNKKIRKLSGSVNNYTVSTIAEFLSFPQGITADNDGNLYVSYDTVIAKLSFQ